MAQESSTCLVLGAESTKRIREHLQVAYPEEACGGLLGIVGEENLAVFEAVPLANVLEGERHRRYIIAPDDVLQLEHRAQTSGLEVVGFYHSHPDASPDPSAFDREHAWPWYAYLIASIENGRLTRTRAWRLADDRQHFVPLPLIEEQ